MYHAYLSVKVLSLFFTSQLELFGLFLIKQQSNNNFAISVKNNLFLHSRGEGEFKIL